MPGFFWGGTAFDSASELVGAGVAVALVLALRLTLPRHERRRAAVPFGLIVAHAALYAASRAFAEGSDPRKTLAPIALLCLLVSIARSAVLLGVDVIAEQRLKRPLPKISRDIAQALAFATVALVVLRQVGVEPGSLLTTSALLTAVIGLSLQETLGNLFAGVAIQMQRPFDVDDWIQFDADQKHIGRVIEINWRATKVVTLDLVEVIVPNSMLAKAPISNFTKPNAISRRSIYVHAPYATPPGDVARVILDAIGDAPGVVADPKPSVVTNQFIERGVEYWVRFFTDQFDKRDGVDGGVRDRIWYAMNRAGIAIPYPNQSIELFDMTAGEAKERDRKHVEARAAALAGVDILAVLDDAERHALAELSRERLFGAGEIIVREGDPGAELYVVERGEVVVFVARPGKGEAVVARLGEGKFFGEMALMTGDKRHATVRASRPCRLLEVPQSALRPMLERAPDLAERISQVLAKRQAELEEQVAEADRASVVDLGERTSQLLDRVRRFFRL